jgi:hypothetical protein
MARDRRSTETITALLSSAPALAPVPDAEERVGGSSLSVETAEVPVTAPHRPVATSPDDYDEVDLEAFELEVNVPLVRPRRRKEVDYQTVRINRPTARILRQQWLAARSIDPLVSFTEFATIVAQKGLRTLAEERRREDPDLFD